MNELIKAIVNGELRFVRKGLPLSEIIAGEKPCGGHGKCGKCRVLAKGTLSSPSEAERELLTKEELESGIRLSCCTIAEGSCEIISLTKSAEAQILTDGRRAEIELDPIFTQYGAAIDVGTTTLAARLYDRCGNVIASASRLNPQSCFGDDVISRIEAALGGKRERIAFLIRNSLDGMLSELASAAKIDTQNIDAVTVTGNTAMLSFLACEDVTPFSRAPFKAKRLFDEEVKAKTLGFTSLAPDTPIYLPPCISAFVGADTVCALLATELDKKGTAMLVDIGTNGEMAILYGGKLTVTSTAAGPAFEGVGISMGMRGAVGAVDKVTLVNGKPYVHVIGEGRATGICGSGLVDAVSCMLDCETVDETGALDDDPFTLCEGVSITGADIRKLQLAKSAICAGLVTLVENAGIDPEDVTVLYIAGGFGNYLNKKSAQRIGLLPKKLAERSETVGNAALEGAGMLLLDASMRKKAVKLAERAEALELSTHKGFSEHFIMGMTFE